MPCLTELLTREVAGFNAFDRILSAADRDRFIRNGYVQWGSNPQAFYDRIRGRSDDLQVLAMVARPELSDHTLMQVFASAPPTDAYGNSGNRQVQLDIARELVVPQYEALAMMAAIRAHETGTRVDLNVTLVGGGVFGNDPEVLNTALRRMMEIVRDRNVRLAVHVYNPGDVARYSALTDVPRLTADQFIQSRTR